MVQTSDRKGIECDLCGAEYRERFTYFSATSTNAIQVDKIDVADAGSESSSTEIEQRHLDIDICKECMGDIVRKMMVVIEKREKELDKKRKNKSTEWSANDGTVRPKGSDSKR